MTQNDNIFKNPARATNAGRDDVLMDYDQLAEEQGIPAAPPPAGRHIGLTGGQSKGDERGADLSQFAGPESKASSQLKDPHENYHSGPGNGMDNIESADQDS
jgi:hypothetical protein